MSVKILTTPSRTLLSPGEIWVKVKECTEFALQCGALQSIPTEYEFVEENGITFLVRTLSNLTRKEEAKQKLEKLTKISGKDFNPFLPYEEDLFVGDISDTHLCLLNKFNVVDNHLLIITRAFEKQESWLTVEDFHAMWCVWRDFDSLVFYNAGKDAGASQRHKHLQLVPLPLVPSGVQIPIESVFSTALLNDDLVGKIAAFPFVHAFAQLEDLSSYSPLDAAQITWEYYDILLDSLGARSRAEDRNTQPHQPYNLLLTKQWMLIIPRSQEKFASIAVNSLGFAGTLLVRNEEEMQILKQYKPLKILQNVGLVNSLSL